MRLTELDPHFYDGNALSFDCPACRGSRIAVAFSPPLADHQPSLAVACWSRTGDTFEPLTLSPSSQVHRAGCSCRWHGFIANGEVRTA